MNLKRIVSGLAPALAIAALVGLAGPIATHAQTTAPAATAPGCAGGSGPRSGKARAAGHAGLRGRLRRHP